MHEGFLTDLRDFRTKKNNCLTIIQKQKVFMLELSLNNSKFFHKNFADP